MDNELFIGGLFEYWYMIKLLPIKLLFVGYVIEGLLIFNNFMHGWMHAAYENDDHIIYIYIIFSSAYYPNGGLFCGWFIVLILLL